MEALLFLFESLAVLILAVMAWQDEHRRAGLGMQNLFRPNEAEPPRPEQSPPAQASWHRSQRVMSRPRPKP